MTKQPDPRRRDSGGASQSNWDSPNLKPVGLALAIAIIICAVPLAYRILLCENFEGGFSLQQLFSFKCAASADAVISPDPQAAAVLSVPRGYVAYRVENGVARSNLMPLDTDLGAPPFSKVETGLVLRTTRDKQLRTRPFAQSESTILPAGQCIRVITGVRVADEPETGTRSGGWLPVELVPCTGETSRNEESPRSGLGAREEPSARPTDGSGAGDRLQRVNWGPPPEGADWSLTGPFIVFFGSGDPGVSPEAGSILDNVLNQYRSLGLNIIDISAHSDRFLPEDESLAISEQQAVAVRDYLVNRGVRASEIFMSAHGESMPLVETEDGQPEPQNRRVEIRLGSVNG